MVYLFKGLNVIEIGCFFKKTKNTRISVSMLTEI